MLPFNNFRNELRFTQFNFYEKVILSHLVLSGLYLKLFSTANVNRQKSNLKNIITFVTFYVEEE